MKTKKCVPQEYRRERNLFPERFQREGGLQLANKHENVYFIISETVATMRENSQNV